MTFQIASPERFRAGILMAILATTLVFACKKEDETPIDNNGNNTNNGELPVCSGSYRLSEANGYRFFYDAQGRVEKVIETQTNGEKVFLVEYSTDDRPEKIKVSRKVNGTETQILERTFTYDAQRNPTLMVEHEFDGDFNQTHILKTNSGGQIVRDSVRNDYYSIGTWTYEWQGSNMVRSANTLTNAVYECAYDDKPNPYFPLRFFFLQLSAGFPEWSANNVKSVDLSINGNPTNHADWNPVYHSNGLIRSNISRTFKYECK